MGVSDISSRWAGRMVKGMLVVTSVCVVLFFVAEECHGFGAFNNMLPNGNLMGEIGCDHFGHVNCIAGGPENQFGLDFLRMELKWNRTMCEMDSDGDGVSNGEELGDPCCTWLPGQTPSRVANLSLPGDNNSTTSVRSVCPSISPLPMGMESASPNPSEL